MPRWCGCLSKTLLCGITMILLVGSLVFPFQARSWARRVVQHDRPAHSVDIADASVAEAEASETNFDGLVGATALNTPHDTSKQSDCLTAPGAIYTLLRSRLDAVQKACTNYRTWKSHLWARGFKAGFIVFVDNDFSEKLAQALRRCISWINVTIAVIPNDDQINCTVCTDRGVRYGSRQYRRLMKFLGGEIFTHQALQSFRFAWRLDSDVKLSEHMDRYVQQLSKKTFGKSKEAKDLFQYMCIGGWKYACPSKLDKKDMWMHSGMLTNRSAQDLRINATYIHSSWFRSCRPENAHEAVWKIPSRLQGVAKCLRVCNCHFEIVDLEFFRSEAFQRVWRYLALDKNGFYSDYFNGVTSLLPSGKSLGFGLKDHVSKTLGMALLGGDARDAYVSLIPNPDFRHD